MQCRNGNLCSKFLTEDIQEDGWSDDNVPINNINSISKHLEGSFMPATNATAMEVDSSYHQDYPQPQHNYGAVVTKWDLFDGLDANKKSQIWKPTTINTEKDSTDEPFLSIDDLY